MNKIIIAVAVSMLFAGQAVATEKKDHGNHGNNNGPKGGNPSATSSSSAGAIAAAGSIAGSSSISGATGGNASASGGAGGQGGKGGAGGKARSNATGGAGGQGGNASNGGQSVSFGGTDMGKLAPDVSPPSMPSVTPCTTGMSGGLSIGGVGVSGGGYSYDDLCGWERQHAVAVATNDHDAAADIKHGMTMLRCQRMSPDDRKFFKSCDALPKEQGEKVANPAFQSN